MGIFADIELSLQTRLATLMASPPVEWPNTEYKPVENTVYLRPTLLPASVKLNTLTGGEIHNGLYQIDIFVPLEKGNSEMLSLCDSIEDLFRDNRVCGTVLIQAISRGQAVRQESWYVGFIEISYLCYS